MGALAGFRLAVYSDGAHVPDMLAAYRAGEVDGFTTNPTLMAKAGVADYRNFAAEVLAAITDLPVCFEVLADDPAGMERQAREIAQWGPNVYVKVPICNTRGESSIPAIHALVADGIRVNVTAVMAMEQLRSVRAELPADADVILSVFAGRIADTGRDPVPFMRDAVTLFADYPKARVLWASPREVLNVYQAEACGCHIIAITPDLRQKLSLRDRDLHQFSRETVQMFFDDATRAGFVL